VFIEERAGSGSHKGAFPGFVRSRQHVDACTQGTDGRLIPKWPDVFKLDGFDDHPASCKF
jgi:hypothetical protein